MRITPILSFTADKDGTKLEADFALFWQEVGFGERTEGFALAASPNAAGSTRF